MLSMVAAAEMMELPIAIFIDCDYRHAFCDAVILIVRRGIYSNASEQVVARLIEDILSAAAHRAGSGTDWHIDLIPNRIGSNRVRAGRCGYGRVCTWGLGVGDSELSRRT